MRVPILSFIAFAAIQMVLPAAAELSPQATSAPPSSAITADSGAVTAHLRDAPASASPASQAAQAARASLAGTAKAAGPLIGAEAENGLTNAQIPPQRPRVVIPDARWDHRPGGRGWTLAGLRAMGLHGRKITEVVPRDIAAWCPAYPSANTAERRAFWVGFLSALAFHESTWRPEAVGGGGLWFGLLQIYPQTAQHFKCNARSGHDLKDGRANVACAIRILNHTIPRDRAIALRDTRWRGVAADWGPMRDAQDVAEMQRWTRAQPYCQMRTAPRRSQRPPHRPVTDLAVPQVATSLVE